MLVRQWSIEVSLIALCFERGRVMCGCMLITKKLFQLFEMRQGIEWMAPTAMAPPLEMKHALIQWQHHLHVFTASYMTQHQPDQ